MPKAEMGGRGGRRLEWGQENVPFRVRGIEFHPASHGQPLKGRLRPNKAPSGCSGKETGGQEARKEAAAMYRCGTTEMPSRGKKI